MYNVSSQETRSPILSRYVGLLYKDANHPCRPCCYVPRREGLRVVHTTCQLGASRVPGKILISLQTQTGTFLKFVG